MQCPVCNLPTHRLISRAGVMACATCRGLSEGSGVQVQNILTRNSERVRAQQHTHEGDIILPHKFDVSAQEWVPNPDFVDKYPRQLTTYFTPEELKKHGYSKADKLFEADAADQEKIAEERAQVEFVADEGGEKMAETVEAIDS